MNCPFASSIKAHTWAYAGVHSTVAVLTAACIKCANKLDVELYIKQILKPIQLSLSQKYWSLWQTGSSRRDDKEQGEIECSSLAFKE
jgi:hypothetical protein